MGTYEASAIAGVQAATSYAKMLGTQAATAYNAMQSRAGLGGDELVSN